jgi:hypothetical protein
MKIITLLTVIATIITPSAFAKAKTHNFQTLGVCYTEPNCQGQSSDQIVSQSKCEDMIADQHPNLQVGSWGVRDKCVRPTITNSEAMSASLKRLARIAEHYCDAHPLPMDCSGGCDEDTRELNRRANYAYCHPVVPKYVPPKPQPKFN